MNLDRELGTASGKPQESPGTCVNDATMMVLTAACLVWYAFDSEKFVWWHGLLFYPLLLSVVCLNVPKVAGAFAFVSMGVGSACGLLKSDVYVAVLVFLSYVILCASTVGLCAIMAFAGWKVFLAVVVVIQAVYYGVAFLGATLNR